MARSQQGRQGPPPPQGPGAPLPGDVHKSPNALIEDALQRGKVPIDEGVRATFDRLRARAMESIRNTFVTSPELKGSDIVTTDGKTRTRYFAPATDATRTLHSDARNSRAEAQKTVSALFKNLTPEEYDLTKRYIVLRDAWENIQRGMEKRPGFDEESVRAEIERLQPKVDANPDVRVTLGGYKDLMHSMRDQLEAEGFSHNLDRDWYFPHTLIDYTDLLGSGRKVMGINVPRVTAGGVRFRAPKSTSQRVGSARDISTNLADQLENYLTDVQTQIRKQRTVTEMLSRYDVRNNPTYKDAFGNPVEHVESAEQIPPGFTKYNAMLGTARLRASSMVERFLGEMIDYGGLDAFAKLRGLDPVEFRQALEEVGIKDPESVVQKLGASPLPDVSGKTFVIPKELANTLQNAVDQINKADNLGLTEHLIRGWKSVVLNAAPLRYNVRNFQGDFQRMYSQYGNEMLDRARWGRVIKSVHNYYANDVIDPLMQQMLDHGVSSSGRIQSEYMLSNIDSHLRLLEHGQEQSNLRAASDKIWKVLQYLPEKSSMREDIVRGVLVDMNNSRLAQGKPLLTGVADKELVQGLIDAGQQQRAVSYIARKSLLDYGDFTPRENKWRNSWFPFYAWASGNFQFWGSLARDVGKTGLRGPSGTPMARASGLAALKGTAAMAAILGTVRLWNEHVMGDYEEKLPENVRSTTHFILPDWGEYQKTGQFKPMFDDEGKVRVWSMRDAMDDFLTYLGLDRAIPEGFSVLRGTLSKEEYLNRQREYFGWAGGIVPKGPVRTVLGQMGPREQLISQMGAGKRFFPDALHPTDIPADQRASALRDVLGLSAIPGMEGVFGAASPGTDIFQPSTKIYDIPKQLGFDSYREPSIYMTGELQDALKGTGIDMEGKPTPYEADLIRSLQQKLFELRDVQGRMGREETLQANRQIDKATREGNFAARQLELQEKIDEFKQLAIRLQNLQRTRRHAANNP